VAEDQVAPGEERNPRIDPLPGDWVVVGDVMRQVVYVSVAGKVVYDAYEADTERCTKGQVVCEMSTWRRWAKSGEVRRRAVAVRNNDEKIALSHWESGQVTGLANRLKHARVGTPTDETIKALFELGLDFALTLEGEGRLKKILDVRVRPRND
jgi:hypothetical protein